MTQERFLEIVQEMIHPARHVGYKSRGASPAEGFDCETFMRHCFSLWGIEFDRNLYIARNDFELVTGPAGFMDVAVFRYTLVRKRHVGVMLNERWFAHCGNTTNGVAKSEITRHDYGPYLLYTARHKRFAE